MGDIQSFDEFVKTHVESTDKRVDWPQRVEDWKAEVNHLYSAIDEWLQEYFQLGVKYTMKNVTINEPGIIGQYESASKWISIGDLQFHLMPVGTHILGAKGRIDVFGESAKAMLILRAFSPQPNQLGTWEIVMSPMEDKWKKDLNEDAFKQLLVRLSTKDNG